MSAAGFCRSDTEIQVIESFTLQIFLGTIERLRIIRLMVHTDQNLEAVAFDFVLVCRIEVVCIVLVDL